MATALMRAAHTRYDEAPLIDDPWGERLVDDTARAAMRAAVAGSMLPDRALGDPEADDEAALAALRAHPAYGTVVLRTRYTEDALEEAVARGAAQYVIVGAGMDSFALRRPGFARDLQIFEVDLPATQDHKRRRLERHGVPVPAQLRLVCADLSREALDAALEVAGFDPAKRAFFSWLGVTVYLTREANLATLAAMARCGAPASEVVFTYMDQRALDSPQESGISEIAAAAAAAGEPWVSGFLPAALPEDLRSVGLELVEDLSPDGMRERYCAGRADAMSPTPGIHVARARRP